jgi:hypothetical protein
MKEVVDEKTPSLADLDKNKDKFGKVHFYIGASHNKVVGWDEKAKRDTNCYTIQGTFSLGKDKDSKDEHLVEYHGYPEHNVSQGFGFGKKSIA